MFKKINWRKLRSVAAILAGLWLLAVLLASGFSIQASSLPPTLINVEVVSVTSLESKDDKSIVGVILHTTGQYPGGRSMGSGSTSSSWSLASQEEAHPGSRGGDLGSFFGQEYPVDGFAVGQIYRGECKTFKLESPYLDILFGGLHYEEYHFEYPCVMKLEQKSLN